VIELGLVHVRKLKQAGKGVARVDGHHCAEIASKRTDIDKTTGLGDPRIPNRMTYDILKGDTVSRRQPCGRWSL
jgi:hypothetical protein